MYPDRGTPQGDVLSPLLFITAIEVLHKMGKKVTKITVGKLKINKLQWSDDLFPLAASAEDASALVRCANALASSALAARGKMQVHW